MENCLFLGVPILKHITVGVIILLCDNPVTTQIRAPDKCGIEDQSKIFFSYFSTKTYVVTPH